MLTLPLEEGYLVTDLETSGLNTKIHSILQIGAFATDSKLRIRGHFMSFVRPRKGQLLDPRALEITGFKKENIWDAPPQESVILSFLAFITAHGFPTFLGYGCNLDLRFLAHAFNHYGVKKIPYRAPGIDLLTHVRADDDLSLLLPDRKLVTVANHYGYSTKGAHDAFSDAKMTLRLARKFSRIKDSLHL